MAGSHALGASVFSIVMVSAAVLDVPTGLYSDRLGRKRCLAIGAGCATAYAVCYAAAAGFWLLALGAVLEGASRAFYSGNNEAFLYDHLAAEGREPELHRYAGRVAAMFQVALGASALLGGLIAGWSLAAVVWLSVVPQVGCLLIALRLDEPPKHVAETPATFAHLVRALGEFRRNTRLRLLTAASVLGYALGETSYQFQAAFFQLLWPLWAIGAAKTLSGGLAAASFHFAGPLIDRFGRVPAMLAASSYSRVAGLAALVYPTGLSPLLMTSTSALFGVGSVASGSLRQDEFTDEQRATMASIGSFASSLLFAVVAFLAGVAADQLGPATTLLALSLLGFVPFAIQVRFAIFTLNNKRELASGLRHP